LFNSLSCPSRTYEVPPDAALALVLSRVALPAVPLVVLPAVAVAEPDADPLVEDVFPVLVLPVAVVPEEAPLFDAFEFAIVAFVRM
jgi:hypothetical protein